MLDRVQLKYEAKAITKNAAVSAYLFTLLYLAIGLVIYFGYGYKHSIITQAQKGTLNAAPAAAADESAGVPSVHEGAHSTIEH